MCVAICVSGGMLLASIILVAEITWARRQRRRQRRSRNGLNQQRMSQRNGEGREEGERIITGGANGWLRRRLQMIRGMLKRIRD